MLACEVAEGESAHRTCVGDIEAGWQGRTLTLRPFGAVRLGQKADEFELVDAHLLEAQLEADQLTLQATLPLPLPLTITLTLTPTPTPTPTPTLTRRCSWRRRTPVTRWPRN